MIKKIFLSLLTLFLLVGNFNLLQANEEAVSQNEALIFLKENKVIEDNEFNTNALMEKGTFVMWTLKNRNVFLNENRKYLEPFLDIGQPQKIAPYVAKAWMMGAVPTSEKFYPLNKITLLEALQILFHLEGIPTPRIGFKIKSYQDLPKDNIYRAIAAKALQMRIITPKNEREIGLQELLTKQQAINLLYKIHLTTHEDENIYQQKNINIKINNPQKIKKKENEDIFDEVWKMLHNRYLYTEKISDEKLMEKAITGMVESLEDPYTVFFTQKESENFFRSLGQGDLEGIGAQVGTDIESGNVLIIAPLKNSPAEKAGLLPGDIILKANNVPLQGMIIDEAISHIKGPAGSEVKLKIKREDSIMEITVIRQKIEFHSVFSRFKENFLIIEVTHFGVDTKEMFSKTLYEKVSKNTKGIIIDLRGNPGGFLESSVELLSFFLPQDSVAVVTETPISSVPKKTEKEGEFQDLPIAVLIDEFSASASEIFAGAIQDHKRGIIIGKKSFGKGTVQELIRFYNGSSFKLTVAQWKTPLKRAIDKVGIKPDIEFKNTQGDEIIEKAIKELKKNQ